MNPSYLESLKASPSETAFTLPWTFSQSASSDLEDDLLSFSKASRSCFTAERIRSLCFDDIREM